MTEKKQQRIRITAGLVSLVVGAGLMAVKFYVYRLTGSSTLLGVVGFTSQIPGFFLSPFAGVWVDRLDRRMILQTTQGVCMVLAMLLAVLVLSESVMVWHVVVFSLLLGAVRGIDVPARQAFILDMLDRREDLSNAIAMNSMLFNGARFIGPALAGIVIDWVGEGWCFVFNSVSYLSIIVALAFMRLRPVEKTPKRYLFHQMKEGLSYAVRFPAVRIIMVFVALGSLFGLPYLILLPVFANKVLLGGPRVYGYLVSSVGVGALLGGLFLASRKTVVGLERVIAYAPLFLAFAFIAFSWSRVTWLSMILIGLVGLGMMVYLASCTAVVQTIVGENIRGRVMSIHMMIWSGAMPVGNLLLGRLADLISAPWTLSMGGFALLLGFLFLHSKMLRQRSVIAEALAQQQS